VPVSRILVLQVLVLQVPVLQVLVVQVLVLQALFSWARNLFGTELQSATPRCRRRRLQVILRYISIMARRRRRILSLPNGCNSSRSLASSFGSIPIPMNMASVWCSCQRRSQCMERIWKLTSARSMSSGSCVLTHA
jgi:hypothetical protein